MVFTHLPSNVLLILVPLMPNLPLAALVLVLRFCISQMDVPTRRRTRWRSSGPTRGRRRPESPERRARSERHSRRILATQFYSRPPLAAWPFIIAGSLKITYDLLLYRDFVSHDVEAGSSAAASTADLKASRASL